MAFLVKWTQRASWDLDDIESYIAADRPTAARREVLGIIEKVELLTAFPEMGHIYLHTPEGNRVRKLPHLLHHQARLPKNRHRDRLARCPRKT